MSDTPTSAAPARVGRIEEIRARLNAISARPWTLDERYPLKVYCDDTLGSIVADCKAERYGSVPISALNANASFIANAPTDVAMLLASCAAWEEFAMHVAHCRECGETSYTNCHDGREFFAIIPSGGKTDG